MIEEGRHYG